MSGSLPELSLKERVLLWLVVVRAEGSDGSIAPTQAGISQATGLSRGHVSRTVTPLVAQGFLREERARVTGFSRTLKAYAVTAKGLEEYERMRAALLSAPVPVRAGEDVVPRRLGDVLGADAGPAALWHALESLAGLGHLRASAEDLAPRGLARARFEVEDAEAPPRARLFVGREGEIGVIRQWLAGDRGVIVVEAPGGVGKSTLMAEALAPGVGNRHQLWIRFSSSLSPERLVARVVRFLRGVGRAMGPPPEPDAPELQEYLHRGFKGVPVVVVLDDVQKAPPPAGAVVAALFRLAVRLPTLKLALLGRGVTVQGERVPGEARIRLEPLTPAAAERLLEMRGVPRGERSGIARAAQGVPLFLELLAERSRALGLPAGTAPELAYDRVVADLAAGLAPVHLEIASWASAVRTPFPRALLKNIGVASESRLAELVTAGLLRERDDGRLEMHDLVRETFYPRLDQRERQRVHARLAEAYRPASGWHRALDEGGAVSADVTEFLHHLVAAGRREEAVRWVLRNQSRIVQAAQRLFEGRNRSSAALDAPVGAGA